jgi:hypothetical protein
MGLRGKLEDIKTEKVAREESAAQEALLTEQEKARQEEQDFLAAHARKNTLAEAGRLVQVARTDTREALGRRKQDLRTITGLMDQIRAEDPSQELPSFREVVTDPDKGSDEEKYTQSNEEVAASIAELRKQKEALAAMGVNADKLSDDELIEAVQKAQEDSNTSIRDFLIRHPESELPEAVQEREERIAEVNRKIEGLQGVMESHAAWGKEHVSPDIRTWNLRPPEDIPNWIRERIASAQETLESERTRLAQIDTYKAFLEGEGIMKDPEVERTYQPAVSANEEVRTLQDELDAIRRKQTSKFFGYTEKKKEEEIIAKTHKLSLKKEEAARNSTAYEEAGRQFNQRFDKFKEIFQTGLGKKGGYKEMKSKLENSIQETNARIGKLQEELENASYYAEARRALMNEVEAHTQELALLKGEQSADT